MKFLVKDDAEENQYFYADHCDYTLSATRLDEVLTVLEKVEQLQASGYWVAGWISYEASPAFELRHKIKESESTFPLVYFMAVRDIQKVTLADLKTVAALPLVDEICPKINETEYTEACSSVLDYIKNGDIYQANYSFRCTFPLSVDPFELFCLLEDQHPVPYSFYMDNDEWQVLSQSPELFLRREGTSLLSKPMKGTIKRGLDYQTDENNRLILTEDLKSRAENVMIVDLMRNDMSRVCELNTVDVPDLFTSSRYVSLHQLTSSVQGKVHPQTTAVEILKATFPAGSITGAPKIRAMEIIDELESDGRGLYTGSAGLFKPGGDFLLNVCIRTLVVTSGQATLGIGSGIVADSAESLEWEECLLKSSFINSRQRHSEIFETVLLRDGEIYLFDEHLQRLANSCRYFLWSFPEKTIRKQLAEIIEANQKGSYRLRISVKIDKKVSIALTPLPEESLWQNSKLKVYISAQSINSQNPYLYHKTDCRKLYNEEFSKAREQGFDEVLFLNEKKQVCEGAISNIFIRKGEQWSTPELNCGLLPGTWRAQQILQLKAQQVPLTLVDLEAADEIVIGNSVRLGGVVNYWSTDLSLDDGR